jgi:acyl carrier protein
VQSQPQIIELLVQKYGVDAQRISADATLADLGLDSLSVAELVFDIEDLFKIEVKADDAEFKTLGEAISLVDRYVAAKGS